MTVTNQHKSSNPAEVNGPATSHAAADSTNYLNAPTARVLAVLRIAFGLTFLWAFVDKLFALGFHTGYGQDGKLDRFGAAAWINGGSPTEGFLKFGADGPSRSPTTRSAEPLLLTGASCSACWPSALPSPSERACGWPPSPAR